jgi:hypothetical protein
MLVKCVVRACFECVKKKEGGGGNCSAYSAAVRAFVMRTEDGTDNAAHCLTQPHLGSTDQLRSTLGWGEELVKQIKK